MGKLDTIPQVTVRSRAEWRAWLRAHHASSDGIWLVTYKKHTGDAHMPYEHMIEEALCYGWIDGLARRLDEDRSMLLLTPRRPGSVWSRPNKERVARLVAAKRMKPAGLAAVERARRDGSWDFLDDVEALVIPQDLAAALAADKTARQGFDRLTESWRKRLLHWLKTAKGEATRARRISDILARCRP